MKRRDLLVLGAAAAIWPRAVRAQAISAPRIGVLMLGNPDPGVFLRELREALRALGYVEGRNLALELRNANGSLENLNVLARELVALKVDADFYRGLWVNSHESCPDWMPPPDEAAAA